MLPKVCRMNRPCRIIIIVHNYYSVNISFGATLKKKKTFRRSFKTLSGIKCRKPKNNKSTVGKPFFEILNIHFFKTEIRVK